MRRRKRLREKLQINILNSLLILFTFLKSFATEDFPFRISPILSTRIFHLTNRLTVDGDDDDDDDDEKKFNINLYYIPRKSGK